MFIHRTLSKSPSYHPFLKIIVDTKNYGSAPVFVLEVLLRLDFPLELGEVLGETTVNSGKSPGDTRARAQNTNEGICTLATTDSLGYSCARGSSSGDEQLRSSCEISIIDAPFGIGIMTMSSVPRQYIKSVEPIASLQRLSSSWILGCRLTGISLLKLFTGHSACLIISEVIHQDSLRAPTRR